MRSFLRDLLAAFREVIHPQPWPEPPRDETTPQVIADWVASHRHPAECAWGCQCEPREEG